jgi:hypothetical protein
MANERGSSSFLLLAGQNVLVTPNSQPVRLRGALGLSITLALDSGVVGAASAFKLQTSDFGPYENNPPAATQWVDIPSSTIVWAGATIAWNVTDTNAKWFRLVYTDAGVSTAPTFTAWCTIRRNIVGE